MLSDAKVAEWKRLLASHQEFLAKPACADFCPPEWAGHWREYHRGHGCRLEYRGFNEVPTDDKLRSMAIECVPALLADREEMRRLLATFPKWCSECDGIGIVGRDARPCPICTPVRDAIAAMEGAKP